MNIKSRFGMEKTFQEGLGERKKGNVKDTDQLQGLRVDLEGQRVRLMSSSTIWVLICVVF